MLAALAVLTACSSTGSYELLRFFFDGVPAPGEAQQKAAPASLSPSALTPRPVAPHEPMTVHRPYAEGKCDKCHASRFGKPVGVSSIFQGVPMLLEPIEKLCFKCHAIEPKRFLHAPAISGQCIFCHEPHRAPNKRMLLLQSTRDLCARCHSGATFLTEQDHGKYGARECIECHDPHAADFEFNLLPGARSGAPEPRKPTVSFPTEW